MFSEQCKIENRIIKIHSRNLIGFVSFSRLLYTNFSKKYESMITKFVAGTLKWKSLGYSTRSRLTLTRKMFPRI